ncbi:hypothetical protein TheetDRAFT_0933 [Thermoanaerobacter ethanolicus JW 200]|nr:hypothetical protein TheetDRAFT_0933 [Thermoanaerobacter ethanolicus JW 200]
MSVEWLKLRLLNFAQVYILKIFGVKLYEQGLR